MAPVTVQTEAGWLEGERLADGGVVRFRGVPYGQPPVGGLRWRPPQPMTPWSGTRPALEFGPSAPQPPVSKRSMLSVDLTRQDEDCLYLNVWTGGLDPSERRPVIVWLHYGGFILGGAADPLFNGEMLAREGAVVVTVNYRLGRLGYLAHPWLSAESADRTSGNFGLLDQLAALEWVQQNISAFGGDPGCVTLTGLSAGAASTSMLMTSPLAAGLFHRAVGMSGGIFGSRRPPGVGDSLESLDEAEAAGERVVAALGARALEDLRRLDATRVNETRLPAPPEAPKLVFPALGEAIPGPGTGAHPIIDGRVIPGDPYDAFANGRQIDVPVMTGSARDECTGMPYFESADEFVQAAQALYGQDAAEFLQLFPAGSDAEAKDSSARAMADRIFIWQNWTWARLHSRSADSPTFYYHTSYAPPVPSDRGYLESEPGAFHTIEAFYVFGGMRTKDWPWTHKDEALSKTMRRFWLNFAASGDPSGPGLPGWPRFDPTDPVAMHFGAEVRRGPVPRREHLHFWDRYFGRPQPIGGQTH